jgi:hypothetical protein
MFTGTIVRKRKMENKTQSFQEKIDLILSRYTLVDQKFVRQERYVSKKDKTIVEMMNKFNSDSSPRKRKLIFTSYDSNSPSRSPNSD